jgi:hypothetical protein
MAGTLAANGFVTKRRKLLMFLALVEPGAMPRQKRATEHEGFALFRHCGYH